MSKTLLFLAASPVDQARLALGREHAAIEKLLPAGAAYQVAACFDADSQNLQAALHKYQPAIVHFSGHGETASGLAFSSAHGQSHWISPEVLADLFQHFPGIECVLLNACYSAGQAKVIARRVPRVIGMSESISDAAALVFSEAFYLAWFNGKSLEQAYELGCNALALAPGLENERQQPVLLKQSALDTQRLQALKAALFERMEEIGEAFQPLGNYIKHMEKNGVSENQAFVLDTIEDFLLNRPGALPADTFQEFCRSQLARETAPLDYTGLARRLQHGGAALFLGLDTAGDGDSAAHFCKQLSQSGGECRERSKCPSLPETCECLQLHSGRGFLLEQVRRLLPGNSAGDLYTLLAGVQAPLLIIHAAYDDALEQAFKSAGKRHAVVSHAGERERRWLEVAYSDRADAPLQCNGEQLSSLQLLENGYSIIYRIRGLYRAPDQEWLLLSEQDYLNFARSVKIPDYLVNRLDRKSLWFLGHYPRAWEDRMLINAVLEKRSREADITLAIHKDADGFARMHWKKRHQVDNYPLALQEFVSRLQQHLAA